MFAMPVILSLAGYFVFAAAVGAMSPPSDAQKTRFYGWLYRFLQRLAANADKLVEAKYGNLLSAESSNADGGVYVASSTTKSSSVTVASNGK
jgi:hypothetical protein